MFEDFKLTISGVSWARRHKREFDAVISIEDVNIKKMGKILRFHTDPKPEHLILKFADLNREVSEKYLHIPELKMASEDDIILALDFAKNKTNLLIHCHAGVSRSTAIGLAVLSDRFGYGNEKKALDALLTIKPDSAPNVHVVKLADKILNRNGKLFSEFKKWDDNYPNHDTIREMNRLGYFREHHITE